MKPRILVVSSANMDFVMRTDKAPDAGETLTGASYEYIPGGKGANAATAVVRLGGDSIFCARLGNDANGAALTKIYKDSGIDSRFIKLDRASPTGLAAITVEEETGENRIIVFPGANDRLSPSDVEEAFISYPDALFVQFEIPAKTVIAAVALANEKGIPVFVDAGPADVDFPLEELGELEVFSPNESETYAYTGIQPVGEDSCLRACMELERRVRAKYYVLKLGDRGAFVYDGRYRHAYPSHNVKAVDTTAAGDAFSAALTLEYMRSTGPERLKRACEYANIVGAITVSRAGAFPSIPTQAEVGDFIFDRDIKFRL